MEDKNFGSNTENPSEQSDSGEILIGDLSSFSVLNQDYISNSFKAKYKVVAVGNSNMLTEISVNSYEAHSIHTEIQVMSKSEDSIYAEIHILSKGEENKDTEITISYLGEHSILTEITVYYREELSINTEIQPRLIGENNKDVDINIMYRTSSDILTEILVSGFTSIEVEIEVPPNNRMMAVYHVQQPTIVTDIFNPTQDSFTREQSAYQSINYGKGSSMVVGRSVDEIWRSFVQFDLSSINHSYLLTESYLRLYYKGSVPENIQLEILNADTAWQEDSITYLNQPSPIELISNDFTVNKTNGYIEFNVLDVVESWVALHKINNGFILRLSNETSISQTTFNTRETALPPELIVKYYDSRIFSQGRSQQITEIFIYKPVRANVNTEITVDSSYRFSVHDTEVYVHRIEVPLNSDILTEIIVSKPYVHVEIISTIPVVDDVPIEIGVRFPFEDKKETEIVVNKPTLLVEITATIHDESSVETEISVTKPYVDAEITVPTHDTSSTTIEIIINDIRHSKIPTEITVSKKNVPTEISVRVEKFYDLYTVVYASKPQIEVELVVTITSDIWVEIEPNIKSDVLTEISPTRPKVEASITVQRYEDSEKDTEVYVKYNRYVDTVIDAKSISQVNTIIDIKAVSQVPIEISTTKRYVHAEIVIPTWVDYDILTELEPRILMVNNLYTVIQVGDYGGAYAFII